MEVSYELTQQDFVESFLANRQSKPAQRWGGRFFIVFACLMAATAIFTLLTDKSPNRISTSLPLLLIAGFWSWLWWRTPRSAARKQFRQQPAAHGLRMLVLDDWGMHWRWSGGSGELEWKTYIRWVEGKNQFLLYSSPACFNIVPKRAFTPSQLDELRSLLTTKIP